MKKLKLFVLLTLVGSSVFAQTKVTVNLDVKHVLGEVETFDRQKFVNFHSTVDQTNWNSGNAVSDLRDDFLNKNDVYVGRNTGTITWAINNNITEDPTRPGFADPASIVSNGAANRSVYASRTVAHPYEHRSALILCTQLHPFYPDGTETNKGWSFSDTDTDDEPFGTASGEFYGRFIQEYFGQGGTTGEPAPTFVEVVNEPLWDLVTTADDPESLTRVFEFHSTVAKEVHKYNPDAQVGGYCAAFPDFDKDDFQRWDDRWKHFMDVAGADVDYWTIHMYDFPCIGGKAKYRKGSNMEATIDMMEQYSMMTLGKVKPLMVSEYGAQTHDYNNVGWSAYSDWLKIKSTNSQMLQYMEHANNINIAMPFLMLKAEWQYNAAVGPTSVHTSRIMRREGEPTSFTGDYVYAETAKIYELWSDVKGTRVDSQTDDLDIMCDAFVDGNKAYVIVNNLNFTAQDIELDLRGMAQQASDIEVRHLYLNGRNSLALPALDVTHVTSLADNLTIGAEGTYIFTFTYDNDVAIDKTSNEKKYYADAYMKEILTSRTRTFNINGVEKGAYGEAMLRIGVGRDHGLSLTPTVTINGQSISVPSNHRGGDQGDRDNFFGVLEIPVPYSVLAEDNVVEVLFPSTGGYISTVTLQAFDFSTDIRSDASAVKHYKKDLGITLYPNPTTDGFSLDVADNASYDLRIFDMKGQVMMSSSTNMGSQYFDIKGLNQGTYCVEINMDGDTDVMPLVIN